MPLTGRQQHPKTRKEPPAPHERPPEGSRGVYTHGPWGGGRPKQRQSYINDRDISLHATYGVNIRKCSAAHRGGPHEYPTSSDAHGSAPQQFGQNQRKSDSISNSSCYDRRKLLKPSAKFDGTISKNSETISEHF